MQFLFECNGTCSEDIGTQGRKKNHLLISQLHKLNIEMASTISAENQSQAMQSQNNWKVVDKTIKQIGYDRFKKRTLAVDAKIKDRAKELVHLSIERLKMYGLIEGNKIATDSTSKLFQTSVQKVNSGQNRPPNNSQNGQNENDNVVDKTYQLNDNQFEEQTLMLFNGQIQIKQFNAEEMVHLSNERLKMYGLISE